MDTNKGLLLPAVTSDDGDGGEMDNDDDESTIIRPDLVGGDRLYRDAAFDLSFQSLNNTARLTKKCHEHKSLPNVCFSDGETKSDTRSSFIEGFSRYWISPNHEVKHMQDLLNDQLEDQQLPLGADGSMPPASASGAEHVTPYAPHRVPFAEHTYPTSKHKHQKNFTALATAYCLSYASINRVRSTRALCSWRLSPLSLQARTKAFFESRLSGRLETELHGNPQLPQKVLHTKYNILYIAYNSVEVYLGGETRDGLHGIHICCPFD
jgi:hypothetical protein